LEIARNFSELTNNTVAIEFEKIKKNQVKHLRTMIPFIKGLTLTQSVDKRWLV
jgi:hypothetical protein